MKRTTGKWARRALVAAVVAAVVSRWLSPERTARAAGHGSVIGGDTWPPVPAKPDRSD